MVVSRQVRGRGIQLHIKGSLDVTTALELRPEIDHLVDERPSHVVVDISGVSYMDSSGVGALVSLFKQLRERGGAVRIVGAQLQPLAVLKLLNIDKLLSRPLHARPLPMGAVGAA